MAQHAPTARICRVCDGFAAVAITTGTRLPDGSRATVRVTCPTCKGTGRSVPTALVRAGR